MEEQSQLVKALKAQYDETETLGVFKVMVGLLGSTIILIASTWGLLLGEGGGMESYQSGPRGARFGLVINTFYVNIAESWFLSICRSGVGRFWGENCLYFIRRLVVDLPPGRLV